MTAFPCVVDVNFISQHYVSKPDQANETVKAAQTFGVRAIAIQAGSADAAAVAAAVERTVAELGGIDILVQKPAS